MEEADQSKSFVVTIEPVTPEVVIKQETSDNVPDTPIQEAVNLNEANNCLSTKDNRETVTSDGVLKCNNAVDKSCDEPDETTSNPWCQVKCVFCSQILISTYEPKLLECLHAACSACVSAKLQDQEQSDKDVIESSIECPACHVSCNTQNIIDNQFLVEHEADSEPNSEEVTVKSQDIKCSSCSDNAAATSWCVDCAEFICDSCVKAHQRLKITKDHTIKAKEEAESETKCSTVPTSKTISCVLHPQEQLTLFCEVCDKLTCRDCQLSDHRDHKYKFVHEIASETRDIITGLLGEVSYKRVLLKSAMKVIDERQNLITDKKKLLVKEITQMVVRLTNAISARGKQLVLYLNEVCDAKQKTLNEKKEALEQLSFLTDHCIEFVNNALTKGSDMALLYSKKSVTSHLQRIKSRRADIPNPEIPVRISLAFEKVPELIRVLSSIGTIVVDGRVYPCRSADQAQPPAHLSPIQIQQAQSQIGKSTMKTEISSPPQVPTYITPPTHYQGLQRTPIPAVTPPLRRFNRDSPIGESMHQVEERNVNVRNDFQMMRNISVLRNNQLSSNYNVQQQQGFGSQVGMSPQIQQPQISISPLPQPPPLHPGNQSTHMGSNLGGNSLQQMGLPPHLAVSMRHFTPSQQVTSSTHSGTDSNIRNLLSQPPNVQSVYGTGGQLYRVNVNLNTKINRFKNQQNFQQNQVGHTLNRLRQGNVYNLPPQSFAQHIRNTMRNSAQTAPPPYIQSQLSPGPQWHIPQQQGSDHSTRPPPASLPIDESFKIHLKTQGNSSCNGEFRSGNSSSSSVASAPKTPSPGTPREDPNLRMDKFCQESVNDLMATIAKLDSNGIEVIPEISKHQIDSLVDSSTPGFCNSVQSNPMKSSSEATKEDSNEDWCAVCMDGGELICCDNCPKVFHVNCHIPPLKSIPGESETWQCLLCTDVTSLVPPKEQVGKRKRGLSYNERKLAERVVLELYCQYETSLHFRELAGPDDIEYNEKIKKPMALDVVRGKLDPDDANYYSSLREVILDVRRIFKNAKLYYNKDSQAHQDATLLEEFFEKLLTRWIPDYAFDELESDDEISSRKIRRLDNVQE